MPAPRAAKSVSRLASRKSEVGDRSLYAAALDDPDSSDSDHLPQAPPSKTGIRKSNRSSHPPDPTLSLPSNTAATTTTAGKAKVASSHPNKRQKTAPAPSASTATASVPSQSSASTSNAVPGPSRGFLPRGAPTIPATLKADFSHQAVASDDEDPDGEFAFSSKLPTPKSAKKRPAESPPKANDKKAKNPRKAPPSPSASAAPPAASSSRLDKSPPQRTATSTSARRDTSAPILEAETPVQRRNVALRLGTSVRKGSGGGNGDSHRSSGGGRGSLKRASMLGFDLPHPDVPDERLYKSTPQTDPEAVRLRSILMWCSERRRNQLLGPNAPALGEERESEERRLAREIIDGFITGVVNREVGTHIEAAAEAGLTDEDLPDHPQNIDNTTRLAECQDAFKYIEKEQSMRSALDAKYASWLQPRAPLDRSSPPISFDLVDRSLPRPTFKVETIDDALDVGGKVLASEKTGNKSKNKDGDETDALTARLSEVRLQTSSFRHVTHRASEFCALAETYIRSRVAQTHLALSSDAARRVAKSSGSRTGAGEEGIAPLLLAPVESRAAEGGDADEGRDLLRAISAHPGSMLDE